MSLLTCSRWRGPSRAPPARRGRTCRPSPPADRRPRRRSCPPTPRARPRRRRARGGGAGSSCASRPLQRRPRLVSNGVLFAGRGDAASEASRCARRSLTVKSGPPGSACARRHPGAVHDGGGRRAERRQIGGRLRLLDRGELIDGQPAYRDDVTPSSTCEAQRLQAADSRARPQPAADVVVLRLSTARGASPGSAGRAVGDPGEVDRRDRRGHRRGAHRTTVDGRDLAQPRDAAPRRRRGLLVAAPAHDLQAE